MANLNTEVTVPPVREAPLVPTQLENGRWAGYRQLVVSGLKILRREPEAIFWVFLFPVFLALGLGIASRNRPPEASRVPTPHLPSGLHLDRFEGAGEVQTPLLGPGAASLTVGDRVYFRHAKAGEMCERFESLQLIAGYGIVEELPTYRGEGQCFL